MQPDGQRKYQLFPKRRQSPAINDNTSVDPERAFAIAMGHSGEKTEKHSAAAGLRIKVSPHNLIRRRKVSVPELGPMTTVQEVAMDSRKSILDLIPFIAPCFSLEISYNSWTASPPRAFHQCTRRRPQTRRAKTVL